MSHYGSIIKGGFDLPGSCAVAALVGTFHQTQGKGIHMFYIGYQMTPVPGKLDELKSRTSRLKEIATSHGAKQIAGFEVAVGPNQGSLFYIVGYKDADAY